MHCYIQPPPLSSLDPCYSVLTLRKYFSYFTSVTLISYQSQESNPESIIPVKHERLRFHGFLIKNITPKNPVDYCMALKCLSEASQTRPPLSAFLLVGLSSKLPQNKLVKLRSCWLFQQNVPNAPTDPPKNECGQIHHSNSPRSGSNFCSSLLHLLG